MVSRRRFLKAGARNSALALPLMFGPPACRSVSSCESQTAAASERPLKWQAAKHGLLFGSAADREVLERDQRYVDLLLAECTMITPENSMKWERLRPGPDSFDFESADWLIDFAEANDLEIHGHNLVWHLQNPTWLNDELAAGRTAATMTRHIETVAGRYAGRVRSWDVVNEAIDPDADLEEGLRPSPWLEHLGPDYIDLAFQAAAEADPQAVLVYNDFGVEYEDRWFEDRRRALLELLAGMVARGVPVDALGIQSHLSADKAPDFRRFERFITDVTDLGLDIMVTELDVRDHKLPADIDERDCRVAATYRAFLDVVLDNPKLRSIAVWGLSDRYSWLNEFEPRDDGRPVRPLPFDREMKRKPAWSAIANALAAQ